MQKIRKTKELGDNLKKLRNKSGLTQEKLCIEMQVLGCDIGRTTYAKYEAGELNVKVSALKTLKTIFDCSYEDFFGDI